MSKLIYLDNAATTQVKEEVFQEMLPYFRGNYSNPSAIYSFAQEGKKAVDKGRQQIADLRIWGGNSRLLVSEMKARFFT